MPDNVLKSTIGTGCSGNEFLNRAILFAVDKHKNQVRKGTMIPYIVHPLETMTILLNMEADIELLAVGVLHDTVEDTDATEEEILTVFGERVASLVLKHSEDKSKTWQERKTKAIEEVKGSEKEYQMLILADKVSNMRSCARDLRSFEKEENFWKRFNAPKDRQEWYYRNMFHALSEMAVFAETASVYQEMRDLYIEIYREDPDL